MSSYVYLQYMYMCVLHAHMHMHAHFLWHWTLDSKLAEKTYLFMVKSHVKSGEIPILVQSHIFLVK